MRWIAAVTSGSRCAECFNQVRHGGRIQISHVPYRLRSNKGASNASDVVRTSLDGLLLGDVAEASSSTVVTHDGYTECAEPPTEVPACLVHPLSPPRPNGVRRLFDCAMRCAPGVLNISLTTRRNCSRSVRLSAQRTCRTSPRCAPPRFLRPAKSGRFREPLARSQNDLRRVCTSAGTSEGTLCHGKWQGA